MDRVVVTTNQNPRLTRLHQPGRVGGDREDRIEPSWVSMMSVQVQYEINGASAGLLMAAGLEMRARSDRTRRCCRVTARLLRRFAPSSGSRGLQNRSLRVGRSLRW
jgi:hypothetical protein